MWVIILVEDFGDLDTASAIACTSLLWNAWKARALWWHHLRLLAYQNTPLRFVKDMVVLAASLSQQPRQGLLQSEWISYPNVWPLGVWLPCSTVYVWFAFNLPKIHMLVIWLVVWNIFFSIYWEVHHPNWRTPSFFRGVGIPPTSYPLVI